MALYRYGGTEPVHEDDGGILRPLDVREFADPPGDPWEPLDAPEAPAEAPAPPPADEPPAKAARGNGGN